MATTRYKLYGEFKWAKVHTPDPKYEVYALDLFPDDASIRLFKKTGLRNARKDGVMADGSEAEFISFKRKAKKKNKDGDLVDNGPPLVVDALGKRIDVLVGNGSTGSITIAVYDTQFEGAKMKGHELEKVEVEGLVEYEGTASGPPVDAHDPVDKAVPAGVNAKGRNVQAVQEDEIPF